MAKFLDATGVTHLVSELDKRYLGADYEAPSLSITNGPAVENQYVSGASVNGHSITLTRAALPVTSLASLGITATAAEINKLAGLATTAKELGFVAGVTSSIQTQINGKANTVHKHALSDITSGLGTNWATALGDTLNSGWLSILNSAPVDLTLYKIVEELPESPAAGDTNKIHLVPDESGDGNNVYLEYIWQGTKWELLGQSSASTEIAIDNVTGLGSGWSAALKAAVPAWVTAVNASGSNGLTLNAQKTGNTVTITGSVSGFAAETHEHAVTDLNNLGTGWSAALTTAKPAWITASDIPDVAVENGNAESGKYISAISTDGHGITVTKASLPTAPTLASLGGIGTIADGDGNVTIEVEKSGTTATLTANFTETQLSGGSAEEANKYVSGVTVSGHTVTVTKATLPTAPTRAAAITVTCSNSAETSTSINLATASAAQFNIGVMSNGDIDAAIAAVDA